jgi:hypothetical protein
MATGVQLTFTGATTEQYDEVVTKMGFTKGGRGVPGCIFHWVTETGEWISDTDVWSDRETFESFAEEQIGPITQEVGMPSPPEITFYEAHNFLTAG